MWINLDTAELDLIESALLRRSDDIRRTMSMVKGSSAAFTRDKLIAQADDYKAVHDAIREKRTEPVSASAYRAAAQAQADDELEIDDDAVVSEGSDPGAWVHAWIWITNSKAGITDDDGDEDENTCRTCGEPYEEGGDGFDGECPSCADKTDQKLYPENYV